VASVRVCRDVNTRRSLGYAYVNFHRVDDAERALDTLNFKQIKTKPCRIMWCNRDPSLRKSGVGNIFVNGLAKGIDNKQLNDTFSVFGNILSCKVASNGKGESLGYGFVHYESEDAAQSAIEKANGKVILGQKVSVQPFKSKKERGGVNKGVYTNVFVKNLPSDISKEGMEAIFTKYGPVTSSIVNADKDNGARCFGFINFHSADDAAKAVDSLNQTEFQGRKLYVGRAQKKDEREKELRERFEQLKVERQKKYAGVNLYIKNLADDIDDERLHTEFAKYGSITSAKVMRDANNNSRGFGFVCFSNPEESTKAVTEMNGKMLSGKPLYVALAQRKDQRRAMLEQQHAARLKMGMTPMPQMYPPQGPQPMMYQKFPQGPQPMMYPQAMMSRARWQPSQVPSMQGPRPPPVNYQLMPVNTRAPQPMPNGMQSQQGHNQQQRGGRGGGSGGGGGRPRNMQQNTKQQLNGQPGASPQQEQGIKYADNVRNRQQIPAPVANSANAQQPTDQVGVVSPAVPVSSSEPLTIKALAAAPEEMKKQMIGERLFPLIKSQQPALAGKITGMLLEMDNGELIHLLESQQALNEKIQEALQVLHTHGFDTTDGDQDQDQDK